MVVHWRRRMCNIGHRSRSFFQRPSVFYKCFLPFKHHSTRKSQWLQNLFSSECLMSHRHISLYSPEWELTYFWVILWPFHDSQFLIRYFETHSQTAQLENWFTYWGGRIKKRRFWKCVYSFQLPYTWPKHENPTLPNTYRFAWSFQRTWLVFRFKKSRHTAVQKIESPHSVASFIH